VFPDLFSSMARIGNSLRRKKKSGNRDDSDVD